MLATIDDKKLNGAGLATLWGIIKQYIVDNPSIPKATSSVLGGIMVGTTLGVNNSGVLNLVSGVVTAGTYKSVTVDTYGRVTAGTNPNTLAGYGITDAKISNGSIILGENSITPITSLSGYATQTWVQQQGYLTEETYKGTVTQVKVGTTAYNPTSGVVSLPAYPTTLPASDVYSWAKAASKPSYTASEVGAATSNHTHGLSIATDSGTNQVTLAHGTKYKLTAGGSTLIFTMPSDNNNTYPKAVKNITRSGTTFTATCYDDTTFTFDQQDNNTWKAANTSQEGYAPKLALASTATIATQSTEYVLTYISGSETAPVWRKLPANAFKNDNTNTWRNVYTGGTSRVGTGTDTKAINFVAGSNVSISYEAAGTGSGQSGNANYFNVKIAATDTTYSAATQSAAGLMSAADKKKLDGIASGANAYSLPTASSSTLGGVKVGTTLSISSSVLNLATSGVTAGTYKRVTVDSYGRVTSGDNTDADTNTWRGIYVKGTSSIGNGIDTKALNFAAGSNISLSFAAAGTGSGQSGNANYGTITISATDTTYSAATQSAAGLMSAADKKKLDGIASGANAYSLPAASTSALGGIKVNYTNSGKNYKVQLDSSNNAYVNVPWENTTYTIPTNVSSFTNDSGYITSSALSSYLPLSGGTMSGNINMANNSISGVNEINFNHSAAVVINRYGNIVTKSTTSGSWEVWNTSTINISSSNTSQNVGIVTPHDSNYSLKVGGTVAITGNYIKRIGINSAAGDLYFGSPLGGDDGIYFNTDSNWFRIQAQRNIMMSATYGATANATRYDLFILYSNGNVGIGTSSPSYKLHVDGACAATSFPNISDIRKKSITKYESYSIQSIANAPLFQFRWKDTSIDQDLHIGSSAQYWKSVMPEAVTTAKDEMCTLSMQYDVIALASVVSVAKETLTLKEKVALLETRVESLEKKIREYESN